MYVLYGLVFSDSNYPPSTFRGYVDKYMYIVLDHILTNVRLSQPNSLLVAIWETVDIRRRLDRRSLDIFFYRITTLTSRSLTSHPLISLCITVLPWRIRKYAKRLRYLD